MWKLKESLDSTNKVRSIFKDIWWNEVRSDDNILDLQNEHHNIYLKPDYNHSPIAGHNFLIVELTFNTTIGNVANCS